MSSDVPYTYADLKEEVKSSIWPNANGDGSYGPENLIPAIDRIILQSVNWLQQNIDCLQDEHLDVTKQCDTYFHCGLTVIDKPDGIIKKLWTVQYDGFCDPVTYDETDKNDLLRWSRWFMKLVTSPTNAGLTALPAGFTQAASSTNAAMGRAIKGLWAKDRDRILISPWLQSYEAVCLDWTGYKAKWNDTDLVPDAPDYKRAVKLFVQKEYARDFDRDPGFEQDCNDNLHGNVPRGTWGAIPALIHQCREKTRQRASNHNSIESDYLWLNAVIPATVEPVEDSTIIAAIGDYGLFGTPQTNVADLVKSWNPGQIITSGNNNYPAGALATIDANVGTNFQEFISPYSGIYGPGGTVQQFWPSLGNRDLDTSTGQPYKDFFSLPNNERYYDKIIGHCHLFFINSGYNTAGSLVEADGNTETSEQANWILFRAVRSNIKWKIAVFNSPPYSSQPDDIMKPALRWDFAKYGFDAVINAGDSQSYERVIVDGFPYFVNGSGGAGLKPFTGTSVAGSALQYAANYGALKITATCDNLNFSFVNIEEEVIDSYDIT